jgi:hypothetical protein
MELKGALESNLSSIIKDQIQIMFLKLFSDTGQITIPDSASRLSYDLSGFIKFDQITLKRTAPFTT